MIFNILLKAISQARETFVPKINFCPRFKYRVMLPKPVLQAIKGKNAALSAFIADRTDVNMETYKRARNHATELLRENRRELESILIRNSEKNPKPFWPYDSRFSGDKSSVLREGTILIEKDVCRAEFNCIFSSSFELSGTESLTKNELEFSIRSNLTSPNGVTDDHLFSISEVLKALRTLDTGKSPDIDGITNIM
ncbi:hypothetical protein QYM36_004495 [Artemia franciscana]|uniref:Uncharacterized protein n=1 Tax=Artemia franciscana TaxID=6661 RepID=A0AA88I2V6_ARTSF|nr:hypothetical protein QYM36_004495 [Artemia franciscana]